MALHSLAAYNMDGYYIRHQDFKFVLTKVETYLDKRDASLWFGNGLADTNGYTFEALNFPKHYARHSSWRLILSPENDADGLLKSDATFYPRPGLADPGAVSFEAFDHPGYYMRHRDFELWVDQQVFVDDQQFAQDATFRVVNSLATFPTITNLDIQREQTGGALRITGEGITNGGDVVVSYTGIPNGDGPGLVNYPNPYVESRTATADDNGHFVFQSPSYQFSTTDPADRTASVLVWVRDATTGQFAIQTINAGPIWAA